MPTTRAVDDIVARASAKLVETRVGEVHLSRAFKERIDAWRSAAKERRRPRTGAEDHY